MTRLQLFEEIYNLHTYNLLYYSKNYLMTEPKEQFIQEWKREKEKVALLNEIIKEEKQKEGKNVYVATGKQNNIENEETEEFE